MFYSSSVLMTCIQKGDFFKDFIYLFLERGEGKEKEGARKIDVQEKQPSVASHTPPTRDLALKPSVCPD